MIVIIPDTNILAGSPMLASPPWESLLRKMEDWQVQIVVPDVVLMETVNLVRRNWSAEKDKLDSLRLGAFNVVDHVQEIQEEIRRHIDTYEENLKSRLKDIGGRVLPVPPAEHLEIAKRASLKIPPYQGEKKDGYRDTLIWLTVMAAAEEYDQDEIWFVSENTKDFGPNPPNWTGPNTGSAKDCPILFHIHLARELDEHGIGDRVKLVTSLQSLEQHLAALHAPISAEELTRLSASLDFDDMNQLMKVISKGAEITPSEAALNPNVVRALLNHLKTHNTPWEFSDGARRGEGRWTANYSVDVEAEIITYTGTGVTAVVTKTLRLSGLVTIKAANEVEELSFPTMSSLPDDPDRALWERPFLPYLDGLGAFQASQNVADVLRAAGTFQAGPSISEMLKNVQPGSVAQVLRAAGTFQGPSVAEMLKNIQPVPNVAEMLRAAGTFQGPNVAEAAMSLGAGLSASKQDPAKQTGIHGKDDETDTLAPEGADETCDDTE